jgi:ADP-ribosyl-[dinitrogen reductase] hydrolase
VEARRAQALLASLLGTAAGDSIGLPFENLSRRSVQALMPRPLRQSMLFGCGLLSDDTEHTVMTALSLHEAQGDVDRFTRRLAARLRWWMLALPPGVGSATARSILKMWIGIPPTASGVFSAGNGPAMRAAVIGVAWADDPALLQRFVRASTLMTHRDPKALEAALAVAVAAACAVQHGPMPPAVALRTWRAAYLAVALDPMLMSTEVKKLEHAIELDQDLPAFAEALGCGRGISGYALHTVPAALLAWMRHGSDFRQAVTAIVACGGDTDSTAAVVGGVVGAGVGSAGIPADWLADIREWPRGVAWMRRLCERMAAPAHERKGSPTLEALQEAAWWPWMLVRNLGLLALLLGVLLRRTVLVAVRGG